MPDLTTRLQIQSGLVKRYEYTSKAVYIGRDAETLTSVYRPLYCVTRICTKSYSYVGLSYSDAKTLAEQKIQKYTRTTIGGWRFGPDHIEYETPKAYCGAQVSVTHHDGALYSCDISVNERDDIWTFSTPVLNDSMFTAQGITFSDYDE